MLVVQSWRSFACPGSQAEGIRYHDWVVVSSGSHNSIHGLMSARGHKPAYLSTRRAGAMSAMPAIVSDFAALRQKQCPCRLMHRSKRPLGSITKSAASHDVARSPASLAGIGCR